MVGYPLSCFCWALRLHLPVYNHIPSGDRDAVVGTLTSLCCVAFMGLAGSERNPVFTILSMDEQNTHHCDRQCLHSSGFSLVHSTKI